ncbi:MAG: recombinase family protein, partial [Gemmatimonadales bacterium]|nr:recombinase family protein [Gemmatimonadales bacterium]
MSLRYAASYARKSTPDDVGIHDQHVQNAQAAERAGYHIPTGLQYRFADDDTSGITKSRKGLDRLRQTAESGEAPFERIYIKDRSRLGRFENPKRSAYLEVLFEDLAVPLFFVHSLAGPSSGLPEHRMVEAISATIEAVTATRSREELIQRTVGGARARMCRGRCPLSTPPYAMERRLFDEAKGKVGERIEPGESIRRPGWTYVLRLGPETEQEVVRGIFASILNNEAFRQIAKRLNTASIPAPRFGSGLRAGWTGPKIVDLVRNPIYMGDLVYGRTTLAGEPVDHQTARIDDATPIRISEMVPAIVSREIWAAAQEVLDQSATSYRARRGGQPIYALSGLMRCVDCGAPYTGFTSTRSAKIRNRYYRHDHRVRKTLLTA